MTRKACLAVPPLFLPVVLVAALAACGKTVDNPATCSTDDECTPMGLVCNTATNVCEATPDADMGGAGDDGGAGGNGPCTSNEQCPSAERPVCDTTKGRCVACLTSTDCKHAAAPICSAVVGVCLPCNDDAVAANACGARNPATPGCGQDGRCVGCNSDDQCAAIDPATPFCMNDTCVACKTDLDCTDANAPACNAGVCGKCASDANCAMRFPGKLACDSENSGACVECTATKLGACTGGKPVCEANACRRCQADAECVARFGADPGVCMSHDDGRCATAGETAFVKATGCSDTGPGSAAMPYCLPQKGLDSGKALVVLRGPDDLAGFAMSTGKRVVVGQAGALINNGASGPGAKITGGDLFIRGLILQGGSRTGIESTAGMLHVDGCTIANNKGGGIFVDGAGFEIRNSKITGNGPGDDLGAAWGGIRIKNVPQSGPKTLDLVTVSDNKAPGISCTAAVTATGVLASGNSTTDISPTCAITPCAPAGPTCGAPQ